jgi:hypothetical protein
MLGIVGTVAISSALVMPTLAVDSVSQEITGNGQLTASVANASMGSIAYSHSQGTTTGTLTLTVDDPRGTSLGWNVTIVSTDFVKGFVNPNAYNIPVGGFTFTAANTPEMTAGQAVDVTNGPKAGSVAALDLSTPRKTIFANAGYGSGTYTQTLPVSLVVPAVSQAGTYTATLTVSVTSAP